MFDGVENRLAPLFFGIPAVKGVEFGDGFALAGMRGSQANDPYAYDAAGRVVTTSNHNGGILGGITSGMPLIVRLAVKPTASIGQPQRTVDLVAGREAELVVKGRHDPLHRPPAPSRWRKPPWPWACWIFWRPRPFRITAPTD